MRVSISRATAVAQTQPTPMDIGAAGKEAATERKVLANVTMVARRLKDSSVRMLSRLVGIVVCADTCRRGVPRRRSMRWKHPPQHVRLAVTIGRKLLRRWQRE